MKHRCQRLLLTGMGWILSASALLLFSWLISDTSVLVWHYLVWLGLLLVWGFLSLYLTSGGESDPNEHVVRTGGISTPVAMVVGLCGLSSLTLMLTHAIWPGERFDTVHLILQASLAVAAGVILMVLSIAWRFATVGLRFDSGAGCTPRQLHDLLATEETRLRNLAEESARGLADSLKQLRESVLYSLHESTSLSRSPAYQAICAEVQSLCASIASTSAEAASNGTLEQFNDRTRKLAAEARAVGQRQVRR